MSHTARHCTLSWIRFTGGAVVLAALLQASPAHAVPSGPGLTIAIHDSLPDPLGLTFGTDGALYVGATTRAAEVETRTPCGSIASHPVAARTSSMAPAQPGDPDALIFDVR